MVLAYDYPFLDIMGTMLVFFAWVIWFWLLITVFADIFRRHDIGGGAKVLWLIFVIILPFLGVFIYLIAESKGHRGAQPGASRGLTGAVQRLRPERRGHGAGAARLPRSRRPRACSTAAPSRRPSTRPSRRRPWPASSPTSEKPDVPGSTRAGWQRCHRPRGARTRFRAALSPSDSRTMYCESSSMRRFMARSNPSANSAVAGQPARGDLDASALAERESVDHREGSCAPSISVDESLAGRSRGGNRVARARLAADAAA